MKKKDWGIILGIFALCIIFDQLSKWAASIALTDGRLMMGPIGFMVSKSSLLILKQIIASVFGVFFLLIFFILNLIIVEKLFVLRIGLTFLAAGFLGKSIDGFLWGYILDWMVVFNTHFNLSDIFLLTGSILFILSCIKDFPVIFHKNNIRKKMLVEKDQYLFLSYMLLTYFLFVCAFYTFFISFIKIVLGPILESDLNMQSNVFSSFSALFAILAFYFMLMICFFLVYLSNKIYGPVYAFKKYIKNVILSDASASYPLRLRKGDHFTDLPGLAKDLLSQYKGKEAGKKKEDTEKDNEAKKEEKQ